jgi:hypothetical protein
MQMHLAISDKILTPIKTFSLGFYPKRGHVTQPCIAIAPASAKEVIVSKTMIGHQSKS